MNYDVVANVVALTTVLATKNLNANKSAVYLRCNAFRKGESSPNTTTTEPVPVVGDANRWFSVALQIPQDAVEAAVHVCITPLEAYTPLLEFAVQKIDLATLLGEGRLKISLGSNAPELKLVVCLRDVPSPLETKLLLNPMQAAYAFPNRNTILREVVGEVQFGYSVPIDFLRLRINQLQTQIEQYLHVLKSTREAQGIFSSDEEAVAAGYYPCAIRVVGIRNLDQTQRLPGSKSLSSPFVSVTTKSPRFQNPKQVGRTNTEYRTCDPVFGTNASVQLAEHASPSTEFECGRFGRICNDGIWIETYLREDEALLFTVYHERHSVYQGLTNAPMCSAELSFDVLAEGSSNVQEIELKHLENSKQSAGTLFVVAHLRVKPSTPSNPFDLLSSPSLNTSTNPFDLVTVTDSGEVLSTSASGCKSESFANLLRIPTYWLAQVIQTMQGNLGMINMMREEVAKRQEKDAGQKCFKSSNDKKKLSVGAITTNLHQVEFSIASTQSPFETKSMYTYTTCGVPSAIALGVENISSSLSILKQKLTEIEREASGVVAGKASPKFDLVSAAFDEGGKIIAHGAEHLPSSCPVTPPCTRPHLCVDETCGSAFHRTGTRPGATARASAKTTSNTLRSAAASIATRFTTSSSTVAVPTAATSQTEALQEDTKKVSPARWQAAVELQQEVFVRETVTVSQSLAPMASAFISETLLTLRRGPIDARAWGDQQVKAGFLIGWESLISTHGKEMSMLSDVIGVVQFLNARCGIVCRGTKEISEFYSVKIREHRLLPNDISIVISIPEEELACLFPMEQHPSGEVGLALYVVLFSQGVNETQSISNYMNKEWASKQAEINRASIVKLVQYAMLIHKTLPLPVLRLSAIVENQREDEKEVDVLLLAEDAVRALKGARQVMCKSGKDRTAMAVTLEQSRLGAITLGAANVKDIANLMREFGVRIRIAEKNVGVRMYSFNVIQRLALPSDYRPPLSVIQDMATSYSKKDS